MALKAIADADANKLVKSVIVKQPILLPHWEPPVHLDSELLWWIMDSEVEGEERQKRNASHARLGESAITVMSAASGGSTARGVSLIDCKISHYSLPSPRPSRRSSPAAQDAASK